VLEDLGQIFARVPAAAEEQRDPVTVAQSDHARGIQALARIGIGDVSGPASRPHQFEDLDPGVIVVQRVPLRRLPDQLRKRRSKIRRHRLHDVPLGRGRQRNVEVPLQAIEPVERESAAVFQEPDHAAGRGVVLPGADPFGRRCGEDLYT
jgi:hypothetical protein